MKTFPYNEAQLHISKNRLTNHRCTTLSYSDQKFKHEGGNNKKVEVDSNQHW